MQENFKALNKNIKNYITRYCRTYCKTLVEEYRDIIADRMNYAIERYYNSYDPIYYHRIGKMKNGVYKKYQNTSKRNQDIYKAGIILDNRYYGSAYPIRGTTMENIYKWSVLQGNHGREVVGNYRMDNPNAIYVDRKGKAEFGTGYKKIYSDKKSLYIQGNHNVVDFNDPSTNGKLFDSPYNTVMDYNNKAYELAHQRALKVANGLLKPGYFW